MSRASADIAPVSAPKLAARAPKILVRGPNWTGDVIMATPGFRALRAGFPDSHITLHLRDSLRPLVTGAPWFDEVRPLASYHGSPVALWGEARALRREGYDLGLCLPDSFASALLMRLGGVAEVVGYRRQGRGPLLHRAVEPPVGAGGRWMIARELHVLGLVEVLGIPTQDTAVELFATPDEESEAQAVLASHGVGKGEPLAVLAPGASYGSSKLWPAESFARVGDALSRAGLRVAVVGTPAEAGLCARVLAAMQAPGLDLAGAFGLGALKALLRRARLLVCNDAGARHIAVAFGVPCVVMMGPTSLEKTPLNLERVRVLETDVSCRPCYLRDCPIDHRCMTRIAPDQAIAAARDALVGRALGRAS